MDNLYCSYYTKSDFITDYMIKMLNVQENHQVFEPSAGDGVFVDKLLATFPHLGITAYELNPEAVAALQDKYCGHGNIVVRQADTLLDAQLDTYVGNGGFFDRIIGNPPYGAWQDYDKRKTLKQKYSGFYVKETYSLFLVRCVELLREQGILSFIIPDTFLNLHMHGKLREFILCNTKVLEILLIPSRFFPGVQFGYSNMAIITLQKVSCEAEALGNSIKIIRGLVKDFHIQDLTDEKQNQNLAIDVLKQSDVYNSVDMAFLLNAGNRMRNLINNPPLTLADLAYCVTGIYTGDNQRFLRVASSQIKNLSKSALIDLSLLNGNFLTGCSNLLEGISDEKCFVPLVKGNSDKYVRRIEWFIDWSTEAVKFYNTDKKARFQNPSFYFKQGIAVPMVKSSRISASLIENQIFDQSIVGVFPKDERYLFFLLALLNSEIGTQLIKTINPTANNSANYIKKVPVILPDDAGFELVTTLVLQIVEGLRAGEGFLQDVQEELDGFFRELYAAFI